MPRVTHLVRQTPGRELSLIPSPWLMQPPHASSAPIVPSVSMWKSLQHEHKWHIYCFSLCQGSTSLASTAASQGPVSRNTDTASSLKKHQQICLNAEQHWQKRNTRLCGALFHSTGLYKPYQTVSSTEIHIISFINQTNQNRHTDWCFLYFKQTQCKHFLENTNKMKISSGKRIPFNYTACSHGSSYGILYLRCWWEQKLYLTFHKETTVWKISELWFYQWATFGRVRWGKGRTRSEYVERCCMKIFRGWMNWGRERCWSQAFLLPVFHLHSGRVFQIGIIIMSDCLIETRCCS